MTELEIMVALGVVYIAAAGIFGYCAETMSPSMPSRKPSARSLVEKEEEDEPFNPDDVNWGHVEPGYDEDDDDDFPFTDYSKGTIDDWM